MNNVVVIGGCGRMGTKVALEIFKNNEFNLVGIVESPNIDYIGKDWGEINGLGEIGVKVVSNLADVIEKANLLMEFTNPKTTLNNIDIAIKYKKKFVIGTTGFSSEEIKYIEKITKDIPVLLAPNLSPAANLLEKLGIEVAQILGDDYDIEIIETHHRNKDDAPSGTAKKLACSIAEVKKLNIDNVIKYGRVGKTGIRSNKEIGIHSVRGGDIPGECSLLFIKGETLEISYRAHSVEAFAQGAVLSLRFLSKKEKGFFEMKDVLNKQF